jgi:hypothetical protein
MLSLIISGGLVDNLLDELHQDRQGLRALRSRASVYEDSVDVILTTRDRWRIPLVWVKVNKGKALTKADRKIWGAMTRGLKPEDAKDIVGTALDIPLDAAAVEEIARAAAAKAASLLAKWVPSPNRSKAANTASKAARRTSFSGSQVPSAKPARRGSVNMTAGLSALTTSMKRRLGLLSAPEGAAGDTEGTSQLDGESTDASHTAPRTPKAGKTPVPAAPAVFVNPRGTNISITPKARSYFIPSRPKTAARSPANKAAKDTGANGENSASDPVLQEKPSDDATPGADDAALVVSPPVSILTVSGKYAAAAATGFSNGLSNGLTAISNSLRDAFSFKAKTGPAAPANVITERLTDEDDDFNAPHSPPGPGPSAELQTKPLAKSKSVRFGGEALSITVTGAVTPSAAQHSPQGRVSRTPSQMSSHATPRTPVSRAPSQQSRTGSKGSLGSHSPKAGGSATELYLLAADSAASMSPEAYRDMLIHKSAENTAKSFQQLSASATFRADLASSGSGVTSGGDVAEGPMEEKSVSPMEQFLRGLSSWGRSDKVAPGAQ